MMWILKDKPTWRKPVYNRREEVAASIIHGLGVAFSASALVFVLFLKPVSDDPRFVIGFAIYGTSLLALYVASTLYHAVRAPQHKRFLRIIDHSAIYVLIAGTYTPFLLISLNGTKGWTLLAIIWSMALAGIFWKVLFIGRLEVLATTFYVIMGWMAVFAVKEMVLNISKVGLVLLVIGGGLYMLGIPFYAMEKIPYNHAIWHGFVLTASVLHFFAVLTIVT